MPYWHPKEAYGTDEDNWLVRYWDVVKQPNIKYLRNHWMHGGTLIAGVSSLNSEYGHWIVCHDGKIYDPTCYENKYEEGDDLEISEAVIVGWFK